MGYGEVGGSAGFIAAGENEDATAYMQVEFSRNVKSFPHLQYSEIRPVNRIRGNYMRIKPEQGSRVPYGDRRQYAWPSGAERPRGLNNQVQFSFVPYNTDRSAHSVLLDNRGVEQASWQVAETELRDKGAQAMTERTVAMASALSSASWGANTSTVISITGSGNIWSAGTVANPYLQISLQSAALVILKGTQGVVTPKDLVFVIDPDTAVALSQTAEVRALLANSVYSYPLLTGTLPGAPQVNWSLPPQLYGFRVAVEDTVVTTSNKGATSATQSFPIAKGTSYLLCRRDNELVNRTILKAEEGTLSMTDDQRDEVPIYSTLVGFFKEEMTVESKVDTWNRVTEHSVVNDFNYFLTSTLSGYRFTNTFTNA